MIPKIIFAGVAASACLVVSAGTSAYRARSISNQRKSVEFAVSQQQKKIEDMRQHLEKNCQPAKEFCSSSLIEKEIKKIESAPNQTSSSLNFGPFSNPVEKSSYNPNKWICRELKDKLKTTLKNLKVRIRIDSTFVCPLSLKLFPNRSIDRFPDLVEKITQVDKTLKDFEWMNSELRRKEQTTVQDIQILIRRLKCDS
jgi:hypothetical protein